MTITGVITAILIGIVVGVLGRLLVPGRQPIGMLLTILVGIVSAFIGTAIARAIGIPTATSGIDWLELLVQVIVASQAHRPARRQAIWSIALAAIPPAILAGSPHRPGSSVLLSSVRPRLDLLYDPGGTSRLRGRVAVGVGESEQRAPVALVDDVDIPRGDAAFE